jgi:hypothetical protein
MGVFKNLGKFKKGVLIRLGSLFIVGSFIISLSFSAKEKIYEDLNEEMKEKYAKKLLYRLEEKEKNS